MKTVRRKPRGFESLSLRQGALILPLLISLAACGHAHPVRYGTFTGKLEPTPIPDLLSSPEIHFGRPVAIKGTIVQVCQEMGCWFEVQESEKRLMVDLQMGRHFTIPKDAGGWSARVEGKLIRDEGVLKIIGEGVELSPPGAS